MYPPYVSSRTRDGCLTNKLLNNCDGCAELPSEGLEEAKSRLSLVITMYLYFVASKWGVGGGRGGVLKNKGELGRNLMRIALHFPQEAAKS